MKEWKAEDLVWPWTLDKFAGTQGDRRVVLEKLKERGFIPQTMKHPGPLSKIVDGASTLLSRMLNFRETGKLPWVILMSNSLPTLQAIANLAAMGYSLTTMGACAITGTPQLVDLFFQRQPIDSFDADPAGESLHEFKVAGFLVWSGVTDSVAGSIQQAGRFSALLEYRLQHRLLTLFTAPYVKVVSETPKRVLEQIERALGSGVAAIVSNGVPMLNIKAQTERPTFGELEV